jgi:hypothetical protein
MLLSRFLTQSVLVLTTIGTASSTLLGAGNIIGVISAEGSFRLANVAVHDNATLFDGNSVQTGDTAPRAYLKDGAWIHFGTGTSAIISGHNIELREGIGEIGSAPNYSVSAKTLRITPANRKSVAQVQVISDRRVVVAALEAPVNVYNRNGLPVAMVRAGETLSFDPLAADQSATTVTGCLLTKGGKPILVDPNTYQALELRGANWSSEVGNRVAVTGEVVAGPTVDIASQVLQNISITRLAVSGCAAVAFDPRIKADPLPNSSVGAASHSHTGYYIIGGVGVAGGVIGVIAASSKKS